MLARDTYAAKEHLAAEEERFKGLVREGLQVLLYTCPHTTICVSLELRTAMYVSSCYEHLCADGICVVILRAPGGACSY